MAKTVHIMCGLPGTGKSSYARKLATDKDAVLFSLDEWMTDLLGDSYKNTEFERFVLPCQKMIWRASLPLLDREIEFVYDFAIYSKKGRKELFDKIRGYGAEAIIYYFNIPHETCKERLRRRGVSKTVHEAVVTPEQFDKLVTYFVPPSEDEGFKVKIINNT